MISQPNSEKPQDQPQNPSSEICPVTIFRRIADGAEIRCLERADGRVSFWGNAVAMIQHPGIPPATVNFEYPIEASTPEAAFSLMETAMRAMLPEVQARFLQQISDAQRRIIPAGGPRPGFDASAIANRFRVKPQ